MPCRSGKTLLELVIALAVLSVGLLGIALLKITAVRGSSFAGVSSLAARFAQDQVDSFRQVPFSQIESSPGITAQGKPECSDLAGMPGVSSILSGHGIRIYRVWSVSRTTQTLKTISVWCCWKGDQGKWHSVHIATQHGDLSRGSGPIGAQENPGGPGDRRNDR